MKSFRGIMTLALWVLFAPQAGPSPTSPAQDTGAAFPTHPLSEGEQ